MGLPRGIPKKTKTSLKGDLAHPVPPPPLPGQGRERRTRRERERERERGERERERERERGRRRGARGGTTGSKKTAIDVHCKGIGQKVAIVFDDPLAGVL